MALIVEISVSGGIGGLAAPDRSSQTVIDDLPTETSEVMCKAFAPATLSQLAETSPPPGRADTMTYHITVTDEHGPHQYALDETQLPAETLDLIDMLIHD